MLELGEEFLPPALARLERRKDRGEEPPCPTASV